MLAYYLPINFAYRAYTSTTFSLPLADWFGPISPKTSGYAMALEKINNQTQALRDELQPTLTKANIRKDLIIHFQTNPGLSVALGTNFSQRGQGVIVTAPLFYEVDQEACLFLSKHEIKHIKTNDGFSVHVISTIISLAAVIFTTSFLSMTTLPAFLVTVFVTVIARKILQNINERHADNFAIENATNEELLGGLRLFTASSSIESERNFLSKFFAMLFTIHPSSSSRLTKVTNALKKRNVAIPDDKIKIEALINLIKSEEKEVRKQLIKLCPCLKFCI